MRGSYLRRRMLEPTGACPPAYGKIHVTVTKPGIRSDSDLDVMSLLALCCARLLLAAS